MHGYLHGTLAWLTDGEKMRISQTIKSSKEGNWLSLRKTIESRKCAQSTVEFILLQFNRKGQYWTYGV